MVRKTRASWACALLLGACNSQLVVDTKPVVNVDAIVESSNCATYSFKQRGRAPLAFLKGVAHQAAKECGALPRALGDTNHDALSWYGYQSTLGNQYAFLIGLGMRESSGKYCEGRDLSASNVEADTAEAGAFQVSYNSVDADPALAALMTKYQNGADCDSGLLAQGPSCKQSDATIYGQGKGREFQILNRKCPAFAVEYASVLIRTRRKHFGPINRKEVEVVPSCVQMIKDICK